MAKMRLDTAMLARKIVETRSQADSFIRMGQVMVNNQTATKAGQMVNDSDHVKLTTKEQYVSRAGYKLASVARQLELDFRTKLVLDVGSSTGGFTDFALQQGASRVIAVDVGTEQLHPKLRLDERVELHEKTDIRDFEAPVPDIIVIDVSFISSREILPTVARMASRKTQIVLMLKPQFEAGKGVTSGGIVKNERLRRDILKDFELWAKRSFIIRAKADSKVAGSKGNLERFYLLQKLA